MMPAAPQPVAKTEKAQPNTKSKAGNIRQLFGVAVKALTKAAPKPAAKKKRRSGEDDKGRAGWRKPLDRRFLAALAARHGRKGSVRASFRGAKSITAARQVAASDQSAAPAADMADTLDWMNPYEPPDTDIDAGYDPPQHWNSPQL